MTSWVSAQKVTLTQTAKTSALVIEYIDGTNYVALMREARDEGICEKRKVLRGI